VPFSSRRCPSGPRRDVRDTAYAKQGGPDKTGARFYTPREYRTGDSEIGFAQAGIGQLACTSSPHIEGNAAFEVALDLPDGASITRVTAYYYDRDPAEHLSFQVGFSEPGVSDALDGFTEVTSVDGSSEPPGDPQSVDLIPIAPVPVDNSNRQYFLAGTFSACGTTVDLGEGSFPSLLLDGVRVEYTPEVTAIIGCSRPSRSRAPEPDRSRRPRRSVARGHVVVGIPTCHLRVPRQRDGYRRVALGRRGRRGGDHADVTEFVTPVPLPAGARHARGRPPRARARVRRGERARGGPAGRSHLGE
jgi:hypothetical protein